MSRIGRRIGAGSGANLPRYIKHPAGSSGNAWFAQNDPIDSGTAHVVDNNVSHLSAECARHLVYDHSVGATQATDGWDADYSDAPNNAAATTELPWRISWDYRTARCYPLPAMIADRDLPEGGLGLREIHVQVYADVNTTGLYLFAALTATEAPPTEGALALGTAYGTVEAPEAATVGLKRIEIILRTDRPAGPPRDAWSTAGVSGAIVEGSVPVHSGYLWVGWLSDNASNEIHAISAYEVPGPLAAAPNEVEGLLVWYRADSCVYDADTYYAAVQRLLDLSGNERHATFSGGAKAGYGQYWGAVLVTNDGSAPKLYFDGGQYSCPHESALNPATWTMFFVWRRDVSWTPTWCSLFNKARYDGGAATGKGFGLSDRTHAGHTNISAWVDTETVSYVDYATSSDARLVWITYDGNTLQMFVNNISIGTVAKVGYLSSTGDLVVGGMDDDLGNQGFTGAFGECGLFNRVLTTQERRDLWENYFKPRYQVS